MEEAEVVAEVGVVAPAVAVEVVAPAVAVEVVVD